MEQAMGRKPLCLRTLLQAGGCSLSYTDHPIRPRRYFVNGRRVTHGVFETVEAAARRRDTFCAQPRRDRGGIRYVTFYSHASFCT